MGLSRNAQVLAAGTVVALALATAAWTDPGSSLTLLTTGKIRIASGESAQIRNSTKSLTVLTRSVKTSLRRGQIDADQAFEDTLDGLADLADSMVRTSDHLELDVTEQLETVQLPSTQTTSGGGGLADTFDETVMKTVSPMTKSLSRETSRAMRLFRKMRLETSGVVPGLRRPDPLAVVAASKRGELDLPRCGIMAMYAACNGRVTVITDRDATSVRLTPALPLRPRVNTTPSFTLATVPVSGAGGARRADFDGLPLRFDYRVETFTDLYASVPSDCPQDRGVITTPECPDAGTPQLCDATTLLVDPSFAPGATPPLENLSIYRSGPSVLGLNATFRDPGDATRGRFTLNVSAKVTLAGPPKVVELSPPKGVTPDVIVLALFTPNGLGPDTWESTGGSVSIGGTFAPTGGVAGLISGFVDFRNLSTSEVKRFRVVTRICAADIPVETK